MKKESSGDVYRPSLKSIGEDQIEQYEQYLPGQIISKVTFLGTSAALPVAGKRNTSCLAVTFDSGNVMLVDCGEAAQQNLMRSNVKSGRVRTILLTHLHGDHCYGLCPLINTLAMQGKKDPLQIVGPKGVRELVETTLRLTGCGSISVEDVGYRLDFEEIDLPSGNDEQDCKIASKRIKLSAAKDVHCILFPLDHTIEAYGYYFKEVSRPGTLDAKLASKLGAKGKDMGVLKSGKDVTLDSGSVIRSADVVSAPKPGRTLALMWDTYILPNIAELIRPVDLLVHECTYDASLPEKAREFGHSTSAMAGRVAAECEAKVLVLTHFSARYSASNAEIGITDLGKEAAHIWSETLRDWTGGYPSRVVKQPKVVCAEDFMGISGADFENVTSEFRPPSDGSASYTSPLTEEDMLTRNFPVLTIGGDGPSKAE